MQKLAKRLSVVMALLMTLSILTSFGPVAKAATVYPQVQYATEPKLEYQAGDIVNFDLYTPNYGGRVQYRVVLWQDETKSYRDLWTNTPDRYYANWMPYGNNIFNLHWKIDEPGHYRITIYAKRAGIANNECYLKGFNCDSYMESDSFVVKAKEVAKEEPKPDIASEKIELASVTTSPAAINGHISKAAQAIIGKDYELAVKVDKPGVKVMFQLDAPNGSLNKDDVLEAVSGTDNIAKVSYKRLYADADYVTAYVAAAPTVRTAMKVYWGVDKILDVVATTEDAANALNGNVKSYKVTLKNPITGERMRDRELLVLVRENIDTPNNAALSTALITNPYTLDKKGTYQRMNNIITGGLNQETVKLVTNDNGEAAFTVTGINTKATPVVFFDDSLFYGRPDDYGWGYLEDSSQYKPSYSGNDNGRWDATELQVEPATVTFNASTYTFEQTAIADPYTAADSEYKTGRTYTVTVKDSEGKPYKNGIVNIAINEYIDNVYGTNTNARFISAGKDSTHLKPLDINNPVVDVTNHPANLKDANNRYYKIQATTSSDGVISFKIASNKVNDMASPIIWIDQDNANPQNGQRNGILEPADPQKLLSQTTFVEAAIKSASFYAELDNADLTMDTDENDDVISIDGEPVNFFYNIRNQNGANWIPAGAYANLTYTIQNIGNSPVTVYMPQAGNANATGITVDNVIGWPGTVTIPTYQTKTISFRTYKETGNYIQINAAKSAKVNVTANANLVTETNTAGGWLEPKTAIASWVGTTLVKDYSLRTLFSSTVFGYNLAANYVITRPVTDTDSYVKVEYDPNDVYTANTPQYQTAVSIDVTEFENQITVDDGLTYRYGNGTVNYISLYNADNSYDEVADDQAPADLGITTAITADGADAVVTYSQETTLFVATGTDAGGIGYFRFGDKVFNPAAGMDRIEIAHMIADASPITIGGVEFDVELVDVVIDEDQLDGTDVDIAAGVEVPGGLKFTAVREPDEVDGNLVAPEAIDVYSAFADPNNTGIDIWEMGDYTEDVITNTVDAVAEQITLTVNTPSQSDRTIKIVLKDGNEVIGEALVDLEVGDSTTIAAEKIFNALQYNLAFVGFEGDNIKLAGNKVIITNPTAGPADFNIEIQ